MRKRDKKKRAKKRQQRAAIGSARARGINKYICQVCGGSITTIERNSGITPPVLTCKATADCAGAMTSGFNAVGADDAPDWEFYRPNVVLGDLDDETRAYIEAGGLILRKIETPSAPMETVQF